MKLKYTKLKYTCSIAAVLCLSVSGLVHAATSGAANTAAEALIVPPMAAPTKTKYVPSVPALKVKKEAETTEQHSKATYTPSVPAPKIDPSTFEFDGDSAAKQNAPKYIPSAPVREAVEGMVPVKNTDDLSITAPKTKYVPSVSAPDIDVSEEAEIIQEAAKEVPWTAPETAKTKYVPSVPKYVPSVRSAPVAPSYPTEATPLEAMPEVEEANSDEAILPNKVPSYQPSVPMRNKMVATVPVVPISGDSVPDKKPAMVAMGPTALHDILGKAYNFNPELKSFRSRLKAVNEQVPQAYAGWLPTATANYSYGYEKQTSNGVELNSSNPEEKSLSVVQPIFNGGETIARTSRAFNAVSVARSQLVDAEQQILLDAVSAYMEVVRTEEILKLSKHNENVLREQLGATNDRFELGETTRTDVAQSEARLARATSDKVRAAGDFDVAKANYLRVIGEPARNTKMPAKLANIPRTLDEALSLGLQHNPALNSADMNREIAEDDISISQSALLPDVTLQGTISRQDGLSSRSGFDFDQDSVTINASIPIFQSGAEYSRVRQNKRVRQQRREEYEATRNQTVENITSRWRDIETSRASIVSNRSAVESATLALDGVRQEADVGTRTTLDVLDAEQELFVAKVNLVTARSREVLATYSLLAGIGQLTAPNLNLNVEPFDPTDHLDRVKYRMVGF